MILFILAYLGGALTIVSPCILPVLPFVFARADQPFVKSGLPLLLGLSLTFAGMATLVAIGGGWAVQASGIGRIVALVILALFGLLLLFPSLADRATRPLVALGSHLTEKASGQNNGKSGFATSLLLGIATGLLWAPCAGPILGLVLTGAALNGASVSTVFLLLAYALGAATSLALALLVGGKVFAAMKGSLKLGEAVRRVLGVAVLLGVAAIASGLDTGLLSKVSLAGTSRIEQTLLDRFSARRPMAQAVGLPEGPLPVLGEMPELDGAGLWLNSRPLTRESLKGRVVVVDFWTYSCINCLRTLPYVKAWDAKYRDQGLVVIGIHTPEFAFEKNPANVRKALTDLGITYPVATDNDFKVWKAFHNQYWPAHYFIDAQGRIRYSHHGEGDYAGSEQVIQRLLAEAHGEPYVPGVSTVSGTGVEAAAGNDVRSPETYVGYRRAAHFTSPGGFVKDAAHTYAAGAANLNDWSLSGGWTVGGQMATADVAGSGISYRFHARDLHLVLGAGGKPVRFRVTLDGEAPGKAHGADTDENGMGTITDHRLYQLIRQEKAADRTFRIEFLDPGAEAYAFTFG
jgi:cytochrome c biogenesis protein CcdA/thiol-disulfide isomerase/thioredoxin